ncbi:MAG: VacJ family lipoprotein [Deltaproteobacteria bacterium]|nr:VacJ family lipoprotein [Deltaproteobacteria bacterium]
MKKLLSLFAVVAFLAIGCASAPPVTHHSDQPLPNEFSQSYEPRPFIVLAAAEESSGKKDEFGEDFVLDDIEIDTDEAGVEAEIADPLYFWNIAAYHFNDKFYFWLLKPVAQGYKFVFPQVVRTGIDNFFTNLVFPIRFINNLLQGKGEGAERELARFAINTMFGFGFVDVAKKYNGYEASPEDFGQTLGKWGVGNGFYLILPLIGPSTARDGIGLAGDYFLDPVSYVTPFFPDSLAIRAADTVNGASLTLGDYEALKKGALDPYIALRNAYVESRKKKVQE